MDVKPPKIENAPGLKWKRRKIGWEARWEPRTELRVKGFPVKSHGICMWTGTELKPAEVAYIQETCQSLQSEMLVWGRGGVPEIVRFDGTVQGLIDCYMSDPDSPFQKIRPATKRYYTTLCRLLARSEWQTDEGVTLKVGATAIADIKARALLRMHRQWTDDGKSKIAKAHGLIGLLRTICTFGKTFLEDDGCARLSGILSGMKFPQATPRTEILTAEQAKAIVAKANEMGMRSLALAQAIQFEGTLRQKDVIGEWVPIEASGLSDTVNGAKKWLRGLRWEEINERFVVVHITSKRNKEVEIDLTLAPMVMAQLGNQPRSAFPASGPVIVRESTGRPWDDNEFRRAWRKAADAAGVPKQVRNMDSRAGAITEATQAGAQLEHIKQAATHGDISMTQRYSRGAAEKIAGVMKMRVEHRNKGGTNEG